MDNRKIEAALLEQKEINKLIAAELAKLGAARLAHERIIAAAISEIAFLAGDPDAFMERFTNDSEDTELHVLGQTNLSTPVQRGLVEDVDVERLRLLERARTMLRLLTILRGSEPQP